MICFDVIGNTPDCFQPELDNCGYYADESIYPVKWRRSSMNFEKSALKGK